MKKIRWNSDKDRWLLKERGIGFEDVVLAISENRVITVLDNPRNTLYKNQKIFLIVVRNYVYVVPFVENDNGIFLKTIFAHRKFTKIYIKKGTI